MAKSITITVPHNLGVKAAKARIVDRMEKLQRDYVSLIGQSQVNWEGDVAHIRVSALGQTANAQVTVLADQVRVDVQLPLVLGVFSTKVQELVARNADEILKIEHKTG